MPGLVFQTWVRTWQATTLVLVVVAAVHHDAAAEAKGGGAVYEQVAQRLHGRGTTPDSQEAHQKGGDQIPDF